MSNQTIGPTNNHDVVLANVVHRDIPAVWHTPEEVRVMCRWYRPGCVNVFAFIGAEAPYIPLVSRLDMVAIRALRPLIVEHFGKFEIDDQDEIQFVDHLLMIIRRKVSNRPVERRFLPLLLWPMVQHNVPQMRGITTIPEENCVFMRITVEPSTGLLLDSIYSLFSSTTLSHMENRL